MFGAIFKAIFGTANDRALRRLKPLVARANDLETLYVGFSQEEMIAETARLKERVRNAIDPLKDNPTKRKTVQDAILMEVLPEAFALCREAAKRTLGMRHYDVQLLGGIVLHQGRIAEMRTGEGKTLTATCPLFLNSLTGRGAHLITVNEYLANRDAEWMGRVYRYLGQTVGVNPGHAKSEVKRAAYGCDITYGTNSEFGFDYLRDNLKFTLSAYVQRDLHFAIVDEVDSILIDEARTPLIISGAADDSSELYHTVDKVAAKLKKDVDYTLDEKAHTAMLTDEGVERVQELLKIDNLFGPQHIELLHHVDQALKAHTLYLKDREYVIEDGKVVIVDQFTGRKQPGRRWSDGLHQAIEAKEGVSIQSEQRTLATITYQNFFRMYEKLAGMTGTADTEAEEFKKIYNLDVNVVPTHRPMIRKDHEDVVFKTAKEKWEAAADEIQRLYERGQPVLVGTVSVEKSEMLSEMLDKRKIPHNVLNAKHHEREAVIVAQAGRYQAVTIATNMAGRGTDIVLGGAPEFMAREQVGPDAPLEEYQKALAEWEEKTRLEKEQVLRLGGLYILGTERHESRRIDNQLRGRAGRQGDPGESLFLLSLEDDLMRIFGGERAKTIMNTLGVPDGEAIVHPWLTSMVEQSQKKVEGHNFDIRKNLIEYDDVMNQQRATIYKLRRTVLEAENWESRVQDALEEVIVKLTEHIDDQRDRLEWNLGELAQLCKNTLGLDLSASLREDNPALRSREDIQDFLWVRAEEAWQAKLDRLGAEVLREIQRDLHLQIIDRLWQDHLMAMDYLRQGIGLRGYGARDPKQEYKKEGFHLFQNLVRQITLQFGSVMARLEFEVKSEEETRKELEALKPKEHKDLRLSGGESGTSGGVGAAARATAADERRKGSPPPAEPPPKPETVRRAHKKTGANEPCPCGSGKKFKKCHLNDPAYAEYR